MSIITTVTIDNNRLLNSPDPVIAICRKQTAICLSLDEALKTVAYLRVSTRSQDLANQKLAILAAQRIAISKTSSYSVARRPAST